MKPQIIHIHGGTPFDSRQQYLDFIAKWYDPLEEKKRWPEWMRNVLTNEADVWLPKMPAKDNAEYEVWKIAFQKVWDKIDFTRPVILTARSLGTIFLVKWLSENDFLHRAENILPLQKRIDSLHLIGSVFDGEGIMEEGMADFVLDPALLSNVSQHVGQIHLWHSTDDPVCPWNNVEKYQTHFPDAILHQFEDRGHFGQAEFPELVEELRKSF